MQLLHRALVDEHDRELGVGVHVHHVERVHGEPLDRRLVDLDGRLVVDLDAHDVPFLGRWSRGSGVAAALGAVGELARLLALEPLRLGALVVLGVGVDDTADERVPHDVIAREPREVDVVDAVEDARHDAAGRSPRRAGRSA